MNRKQLLLLIVLAAVISGCAKVPAQQGTPAQVSKPNLKLYWFIPDGVRAEPNTFKVYQWAEEGLLPNIKWMMDHGSYGYVMPVFPSHTPVNFASLFTGAYPVKNGVADGPMRTIGKPLDKVAVGGFSSVAKWVNPIWVTLENSGENNITLLSIPGSTPPELKHGITLRGRWGGWGADFHAINFESAGNLNQRIMQGRSSRLFFFGPQLTQYIYPKAPSAWEAHVESYSQPLELNLTAWGGTVYALVADTTDDNKTNYDKVYFSTDKSRIAAVLKQGEWSNWIPIELQWSHHGITTSVRIKVIILHSDGFFRIRLFYNNLNEFNTEPGRVAKEVIASVGPMMDFVDNFPPQLIYYPEDKKTFLEEMNMTFDWHTKATGFLLNQYKPDVYIGDIYSPNQMLTSRWWMGYIDPSSYRYHNVSEAEREQLWNEVLGMYKRVDAILGELIKNADNNTLIVLSSDHGAVPLNKWVYLNNLFAKKGWLKFTINSSTGEPIIDWNATKVIYLKFDSIYINPKGLSGDYHRASGPEYEALRNEVKRTLENLVDPKTGYRPVIKIVKWEDVANELKLPAKRVGDLVIANMAGYGWNEEMTPDLRIFSVPLKSGYKQAIISRKNPGMWTPFMVVGPGVKEGNFISQPMEMVDEYPTIMTLLGRPLPDFVQGKVITGMLE